MDANPPVPRAILIGIQVPSVDDVAHAASIEELGRLVKTLGYEVVGTMSQKRDGIDGGTVLGKGRLEQLAATTTSVDLRVAISSGLRWSDILTRGSRHSCARSRTARC
jgi:50S ribosomal subunit-associated GTPase HflX